MPRRTHKGVVAQLQKNVEDTINTGVLFAKHHKLEVLQVEGNWARQAAGSSPSSRTSTVR